MVVSSSQTESMLAGEEVHGGPLVSRCPATSGHSQCFTIPSGVDSHLNPFKLEKEGHSS